MASTAAEDIFPRGDYAPAVASLFMNPRWRAAFSRTWMNMNKYVLSTERTYSDTFMNGTHE
jgi:hypothetical protein